MTLVAGHLDNATLSQGSRSALRQRLAAQQTAPCGDPCRNDKNEANAADIHDFAPRFILGHFVGKDWQAVHTRLLWLSRADQNGRNATCIKSRITTVSADNFQPRLITGRHPVAQRGAVLLSTHGTAPVQSRAEE